MYTLVIEYLNSFLKNAQERKEDNTKRGLINFLQRANIHFPLTLRFH